MKNLLLLFFCTLTLLFSSCGNSGSEDSETQETTNSPAGMYLGKKIDRFEPAIRNMEKEDSMRTVQEKEVLFIGSSSIRMWNSLIADMHPVPVINRGFGGSMIPEVIYFANRIVFPYKPELVVFYCGENDIAEGASPEAVFGSFKSFDAMLRKRLKNTQMIFISMKPSPARWKLWDRYEAGNALIKEYIESKDHLHYFDSGAVMLTEAGTPDSTIFVADGLHMNDLGYKRWAAGIKPMVEAIYAPKGESASD